MSSTRWSGALALGVIFLAAPATAAGCWEGLATATANMTVTEKFGATMNCMAELAAKVEQLEATQPVPSIGKHEKTRAVVAFFAEKGQQACPDEWSLFEEAKNRVIVGAGKLYQYPGETGGEERVTLTVDQMPRHGHGMTGNLRSHIFFTGTDTDTLPSSSSVSADQDWFEGADRPHPNMPPYIALYFCKKD